MVITALKSDQELPSSRPPLSLHDPQWSNSIEAVQFIPFGTYLWNTSVITFFSILGAAISTPSSLTGPRASSGQAGTRSSTSSSRPSSYPSRCSCSPSSTSSPCSAGSTPSCRSSCPCLQEPVLDLPDPEFMMQIPTEISDAARVDGAGEFQVFWRIILPCAKPRSPWLQSSPRPTPGTTSWDP